MWPVILLLDGDLAHDFVIGFAVQGADLELTFAGDGSVVRLDLR